jgi:PAS domain S-box-containing protein
MRIHELFVKILAIVAGMEILVMVILGFSGMPEGMKKNLLDASLLALFCTPLLYLFVVKDVIRRLSEQASLAQRLRQKELELNSAAEKQELATRLQSLVDNVPGMVYRGHRDWSISFVGAEVEQITGYSAEEFMRGDLNWKNIIHPDDREWLAESFRGAAKARLKMFRVEYRILHRNGDLKWVSDKRQIFYDGNGSFSYVDGLLLDVTERKMTDDALRDANQRLTFHVDRMPLAYIVWDRDYRVVEWNPAAERIFGWKPEEALGKNPCDLVLPAEAQPHADAVRAKFSEGDESSCSLNANVRKDGKAITCEWFNTPLRDAAGVVTGVLSMVHDVTEKTQLERQLQAVQRMEAVGTLAGGIAHDFNNALTGIIGFGEMLKMQFAGNEKALSNLDEILRCAERASTLTRQLLTYSRRQVIEPVNLSLNAVITELMKLVSKVVGEHIEIRTFLGKNLPAVHADRSQMEQVVINLVLNARDAMPGGGQLILETGSANLDAEFVRRHPYMSAGSYVVLTVSDTGIGMDRMTQERVFEPFFTTKAADKGTGLGLSMVYGIVKQHNGFINLYSEPGKGTAFKIYLPPVEAAPDAIVPPEPSEIRGGTETVLLAEDDESVRMLAERTLSGFGYSVLDARNGGEAMEVFSRHKETISLALLDVVMPLGGGKEIFEIMHKAKPDLKAIFMSGYTADAVHESFVLIAGVPFLPKPFGPDALARKVREVLDNA